MLCFVLLLFSILRVICGNSPLLQCLRTCLLPDFCLQKEERKHLHDFCTGNNASVWDKRSKQEQGRHSEAYKLHEAIANAQLVTYCILISMFKHPVSCLHVIGLLWWAVFKRADLMVALVSAKINGHSVMLQKNTMFTPVFQFASTLILGTQSQPLWQLSANESKHCVCSIIVATCKVVQIL